MFAGQRPVVGLTRVDAEDRVGLEKPLVREAFLHFDAFLRRRRVEVRVQPALRIAVEAADRHAVRKTRIPGIESLEGLSGAHPSAVHARIDHAFLVCIAGHEVVIERLVVVLDHFCGVRGWRRQREGNQDERCEERSGGRRHIRFRAAPRGPLEPGGRCDATSAVLHMRGFDAIRALPGRLGVPIPSTDGSAAAWRGLPAHRRGTMCRSRRVIPRAAKRCRSGRAPARDAFSNARRHPASLPASPCRVSRRSRGGCASFRSRPPSSRPRPSHGWRSRWGRFDQRSRSWSRRS